MKLAAWLQKPGWGKLFWLTEPLSGLANLAIEIEHEKQGNRLFSFTAESSSKAWFLMPWNTDASCFTMRLGPPWQADTQPTGSTLFVSSPYPLAGICQLWCRSEAEYSTQRVASSIETEDGRKKTAERNNEAFWGASIWLYNPFLLEGNDLLCCGFFLWL